MISTTAGLRARLAERRAEAPESTVALISTIGALHDGHRDLIRTARETADIVVVSMFLNPLRFRTAADAQAYPRTPEADRALLADLDVDMVFAPTTPEMFADLSSTTKISAGDLGLRYEGRSRPFYFDGLLTVEAKLFSLVRPDTAVYGLRDRQRVFLVERMIRDLFWDIDVVTVDTVRDDAGLPVSSRIALLDEADRVAAARLPIALEAAAANADRNVDACIAAAQGALMGESRITLDYLNAVDPATFLPVDEGHAGRALALIAATVGGHRFIDNTEIYIG
ncbi:4-phosphopantoate--beta-alanine ligase [Microbacterium aquimaris]|uniref:Pantothenate synthetase n=1 Tax=Microbacterium aquimaris TaxID=459816 RepID=A0ABU5N370_9MICO|nr:pantoate--beta-alanine ligase [Microbacterium aquimaris]MDZ8160468.1 pantoate--beta-alanine ligase [Microbacterium aquimaris]